MRHLYFDTHTFKIFKHQTTLNFMDVQKFEPIKSIDHKICESIIEFVGRCRTRLMHSRYFDDKNEEIIFLLPAYLQEFVYISFREYVSRWGMGAHGSNFMNMKNCDEISLFGIKLQFTGYENKLVLFHKNYPLYKGTPDEDNLHFEMPLP